MTRQGRPVSFRKMGKRSMGVLRCFDDSGYR
jgi:hypothetical protein